jgi:hypothetical protein
MLHRVRLQNFKLHGDTTVDFAPITIFIGPNNSGKSSIFQALLAWRQAAETRSAFCQARERQALSEDRPFFYPEEISVDLGSFEDAVRIGQQEIDIEVQGQTANPVINVHARVRVREGRILFHEGSVNDLAWTYAAGASAGEVFARGPDGTLRFQPVPEFKLLHFGGTNPRAGLSIESQARLNDQGLRTAAAPLGLVSQIRPVFPLRGFEEAAFPLTRQKQSNADRLLLHDRAASLV